MAQPDVLLKAEGLYKSYVMGTATIEVLRSVSLSVGPGEFVAVMGASGSGKSTLLHILGGLDIPDRGSVTFEGQSIFEMPARQRDRHRNVAVGFVFQFYHLLPELNVLENVLLPLMVGSTVLGWRGARGAARAGAMQAIERVNMQHRLKHRPNELSGGERQRVAIARALAGGPRLLLADEPTGNLDVKTGREILAVLARLNAQGQTIVMVTHDANVAALAHRSVQLSEGVIQESKRTPRAPAAAPATSEALR